ncbi:MAG TPA: GGDEF domain-containing protein [Burkholderiales bacterium]|nr:GGDEF domain-containing protein [Burkholderiales bacterium]
MVEPLGALRPAWIPGGILVAAGLLLWLGPALPDTLAGLRTLGPYVALVTATVLAFWFNRGRSFVIAASLLLGFAAYSQFPTKLVYTAIVLLVPANALLAVVRAEKGARYRMAYVWIALFMAEGALLYWLAGMTREAALEHWSLRSPPTPLLGRLLFAAAFAAAVWRAWPEHTPLQVGNAAALAAFFLAGEWGADRGGFSMFTAAAGAILVVSLLQESHALAFRDQLTGLPGRRALEERLRSLGERYAIAMVDVDHFKEFNDTHGHDIGDQVLKLVANRLAQVGGGGTAYRYGGEEFGVLFPGVEPDEAAPWLEAIRDSIEQYRMAVRAGDRPKKTEEGARRRGAGAGERALSVTVSIGVAGPSAEARTPQQVLTAADEACYRAKKGGRNRLSR